MTVAEYLVAIPSSRESATNIAAQFEYCDVRDYEQVEALVKGVRVNSSCPGFVETPMTEELLEDERFYNYLEQKTPMDRHGQPEEIAPIFFRGENPILQDGHESDDTYTVHVLQQYGYLSFILL